MVKSTRKDASYCINDPSNRKVCILDDPNLCQFDFYSACLEAHPEKSKKPPAAPPLDTPRNTYKSKHSQPFYDDLPLDNNPTTSPPKTPPTNPTRTTGTATPASPPPPAPPRPEAERSASIITSYDVNDGIIEMIDSQCAIDCTFELATFTLKEFIKKENSNSEEFTKLLVEVKEKFFSEKGKKAGWKEYIEKTISYHYRQTQTLIKGYSDSIIREYWNELGIAKISLLVRVKQPLSPGLVKALLDKSVSETKKILFPPCTISKQKDHKLFTLINSLKAIKPADLDKQGKAKLKLVLQETIRQLK